MVGAGWVCGQTYLAEKFSSVPQPAGWPWWNWGLCAHSFSDHGSACYLAPWILQLLLYWKARLRNHLFPLLWVLPVDSMVKETSSVFSQVAEGNHCAGNPAHISWGLLQHLALGGGMPGVPSPGLCATGGQPLGCDQQGQARVQMPQRGSACRWAKGKAVLLPRSPPVVSREPVSPPAALCTGGVWGPCGGL